MYNSFGPFEEGFKKLDWNETLSTDNLEAASECLMVTINKNKGEFSKNFTFSRKKQNLPWINGQLWKLMKQRDHALKIAIKSVLAHDRRTFQHLRNKVVNELRKAKAHFFIDLINDAKRNSREVWENINKVQKKNNKNHKGIELQVHGSLIQDKHQIVSVFNNFFIDSVRDLTHGFGIRSNDIILPNHDLTVFNTSEVSESYIINILSLFKSSRAKYVFNCDSIFIKMHANVLSTPITHLVNLSIKQCHFVKCLEVSSNSTYI